MDGWTDRKEEAQGDLPAAHLQTIVGFCLPQKERKVTNMWSAQEQVDLELGFSQPLTFCPYGLN